ncbi:hypothetical protein SHXM_01972 [Streptomyces hygroscopicus]|nr:hypothetical protein SHXM_01972 [Streptomyces hygroscopicus]
MLTTRRVGAWTIASLLAVLDLMVSGPFAQADDGRGIFGGVSCAVGGCQVHAEARGRRMASVSREGTAHSRRGPLQHRRGTSESPTVTSDGWEYGLGDGLGILPRFDKGKPKRPKRKHHQQVSVAVVARRAVESLQLPKPAIRTSPDEDFMQVVGVPTWMWVEHSTWRPMTETATVPGLRVTATARPRQAVWSMGDDGSVTCMGPGTEYSGVFRPEQSSPDCSYTYRRSSSDEPGRAFTVSVRVIWDVEWHGGGQSGRVPGLVIAAERPLAVDEVQAVIVR